MALPILPAARPAAQGHSHAGHDHDHSHDGHDHGSDDHSHEGHDHGPGDHGHEGAYAGHDHGAGGHDHGAELKQLAKSRKNRLWLVILLGSCSMAAEIAAGLAANSLVLLADAAHAAADVAAVVLALIAVMWAEKAATAAKSFGFHRGEVVAAFVNALALWGVSAYLVFEAFERLASPPEVRGPIVIAMGLVTLVVNLAMARILHAGSHGNLNMKAAYVHVLSDALGSAAAFVAGALIYYKGWDIADPLLTFFITVLIVLFTWRLTRQTLHILMQGTPTHLDAKDVKASLAGIPSVREVHDLHMWTLTDGHHTLTAHVVLDETPKDDKVMHQIHDLLQTKYKLEHVTIQVESPTCPCGAPCATIE